jgi:glutamine synthetase
MYRIPIIDIVTLFIIHNMSQQNVTDLVWRDEAVNTIFAEYVWIDAYGGLRSKNRTIHIPSGYRILSTHDDVKLFLRFMSKWNFDGSSTGQAPTIDSEVILQPVRCFNDPFVKPHLQIKNSRNILVMCDTYTPNGSPLKTNSRNPAKVLFDRDIGQLPWFGMEQEFFIMDFKNGRPIGFPEPPAVARPQGPYYCAIGGENAFGRSLVDEAYRKCFEANITVSGMNGEVAPGQWEIQVGPVQGIDAGDELWMLRYILGRVSEEWSERYNRSIKIDFGSKPVRDQTDSWNGSGMHVNFSTDHMRHDGGYVVIESAVEKLRPKHAEHLAVYGDDNHLRLTGRNETSDPNIFSVSVGGRGSSVRIPTAVHEEGKGYFEDRRPSSSCDPYVVTSKIFETCCL